MYKSQIIVLEKYATEFKCIKNNYSSSGFL